MIFLTVLLELQQFQPEQLDDLINWDLFEGRLYSLDFDSEPKRTLLFFSSMIKSLVTRINKNYRHNDRSGNCKAQRKDVVYVYSTENSLLGQTLILNVRTCASKSIVYKKPQRFFAQRSFIEMRIKEIVVVSEKNVNRPGTKITLDLKFVSNSFLASYFNSTSTVSHSDKIVVILPLSDRFETFLMFLNNFEDVS